MYLGIHEKDLGHILNRSVLRGDERGVQTKPLKKAKGSVGLLQTDIDLGWPQGQGRPVGPAATHASSEQLVSICRTDQHLPKTGAHQCDTSSRPFRSPCSSAVKSRGGAVGVGRLTPLVPLPRLAPKLSHPRYLLRATLPRPPSPD